MPAAVTPTLYEILCAPKTLSLPSRPRTKSHPSHHEFDVELIASVPGALRIAARVNATIAESFSLVLVYEAPMLQPVPILRVNGDHGTHGNRYDGSLVAGSHVHMPLYGALCQPFDGEPQDQYAVQTDYPVGTVRQAWNIFRRYAAIEDDVRFCEQLSRLRGIPVEAQPELFDEV